MNNKYSTTTILGGGIVLFGILLLVRNIFDLNIPIFTLVLSLGLIWVGILLIKGSLKPRTDGSQTMFGESNLNFTPGQQNYSVVFGSGTINLQDLKPDQPLHLNMECTFGELKVVLNRDVEIQVNGSATFGSLVGPDLKNASFGNLFYQSQGFNPSLPGITIHGRVTFGEMRIFYL